MTTTKIAGENRKALIELTAERVSAGEPLLLEALLRPGTSSEKLLRGIADYLAGSQLITADRFESADTAELYGDLLPLARRITFALLGVNRDLGIDAIDPERFIHLLCILDELEQRAKELALHFAMKQAANATADAAT